MRIDFLFLSISKLPIPLKLKSIISSTLACIIFIKRSLFSLLSNIVLDCFKLFLISSDLTKSRFKILEISLVMCFPPIGILLKWNNALMQSGPDVRINGGYCFLYWFY